ncbi:D-2-hydroxyacid dehydrogenase [Proteiniclasticum ruminis]|jgi:D-3-phosphoglycerate dehydrogenase|uniref:2-oxoglutarate reductase n=1 Tax=Proteiniclasticum ruminis TaxID=398199 RepID=A0A1G8QFE3_9CLOT|nr:D-2-hydroxyacid dehydrogenase [Proteiniclasticum ruminis]MBP9920492.1 D-2-hydroxyacid dehydrogenase [Proteiniclasticum sp.]SDJ03437.1 D-3-phosphoglycerate dehydrogenase [Proteiniclasticum ruminis]
MIRILAADGMEASAIKNLEESGFEVVNEHYELPELMEKIKEFDVVVVRSATKIREPLIDEALKSGRLKLVIRGGVGVDNIDVKYAEEKGISVRNTPNASSASVAELAIGHMFNIARHIHSANVTMREGKWNKKHYEGIELSGKTLGLIGFGRIAKEVAKRADALGMKVIYTNRSGHKPENDPFRYVTMEELYKEADFISLHMPKLADRPYLIGKEEIEQMKDGVYLVNTARGGLIDEEALCDALDSGKVTAAAVDVFKEEPTKNERIYTHEKISLTPHTGASTVEAQLRIGEEIISIIKSFFA